MMTDREWLKECVDLANRFRNTPIVDDDFPTIRNEFDFLLRHVRKHLERDRSIESFWHQQAEWSQATFGTDSERGPHGPLLHLQKEVQEALDNDDDIEEYADMLFLVFDSTRRAGFTFEQLLAACFAKLEVNKQRKWPKPTYDMPVEHVRD